jgi:ABC-type lipoprotein release transport system permease subunit
VLSVWRWNPSGIRLIGDAVQDPVAFAGGAAVLLVSAAIAVYIPTRRASKVDPVFVLRQS